MWEYEWKKICCGAGIWFLSMQAPHPVQYSQDLCSDGCAFSVYRQNGYWFIRHFLRLSIISASFVCSFSIDMDRNKNKNSTQLSESRANCMKYSPCHCWLFFFSFFLSFSFFFAGFLFLFFFLNSAISWIPKTKAFVFNFLFLLSVKQNSFVVTTNSS